MYIQYEKKTGIKKRKRKEKKMGFEATIPIHGSFGKLFGLR